MAPSSPARPPPAPAAEPAQDTKDLNATLGKILGQLDLVTKTLIQMDSRLTVQEDALASLAGKGITDAGQFDDEEGEDV